MSNSTLEFYHRRIETGLRSSVVAIMYSQSSSAMAPPQKPETFMLSDAEQQSLPQDAQVALQQVDNCECDQSRGFLHLPVAVTTRRTHSDP